jgi:hypothetical protein
MTKEEQKQMADLVSAEQKQIKDLRSWENKLKTVIENKEYDVLDRFQAYRWSTECSQIAAAKDKQVLAYLNIHNNLKKQEQEKKEVEKTKAEKK